MGTLDSLILRASLRDFKAGWRGIIQPVKYFNSTGEVFYFSENA
jgi:hypothetical protein